MPTDKFDPESFIYDEELTFLIDHLEAMVPELNLTGNKAIAALVKRAKTILEEARFTIPKGQPVACEDDEIPPL